MASSEAYWSGRIGGCVLTVEMLIEALRSGWPEKLAPAALRHGTAARAPGVGSDRGDRDAGRCGRGGKCSNVLLWSRLGGLVGFGPASGDDCGKPRLLRISKRGNGYLRMPLIHGARTALPGLAKKDTPLGRWLKALLARAHRDVVIIALANKLARIAWAVLARIPPVCERSSRGWLNRQRRTREGLVRIPTYICERGLTVDRASRKR